MIKVVAIKENGEVKLTKEELEVMLNEAYDAGYEEGKKCHITAIPATNPVTPYWWKNPECTPLKNITYTTSGTPVYNIGCSVDCCNKNPSETNTCEA